MATKRRDRPTFWRSEWFWRLLLPVAIAATTILCGTIGFLQEHGNRQVGAASNLWQATGLLIGETSYTTSVAPPSPASVWLWTARLTGVLIPLYVVFILAYEQLRGVGKQIRVLGLVLWARLRPSRRHMVVCGLGWRGSELAHHLLDLGRPVVAIELDAANPFLPSLRARGAILFEGSGINDALLRKAKVTHAAQVHVMTGDEEVNCRIVCLIDRQMRERPKANCLAWMEKHTTGTALPSGSPAPCRGCPVTANRNVDCHVLVESDRLRSFIENSTRFSPVNVSTLNLYELAAREVLIQRPLVAVQKGINAPPHVHTVIVGATPVAHALLLQALHLLHLRPNQERVVTVLVPDADTRRAEFLREYPCLDPSEAAAFGDVVTDLFPRLEFAEMPKSNAHWMAPDSPLASRIAPRWRINLFFCIDDGMRSRALTHTVSAWLRGMAQEAGDTCQVRVAYFSDYPEDIEEAGDRADAARPLRFGCDIARAASGAATERLAKRLADTFLRAYPGELAGLLAAVEPNRSCFVDACWTTKPEWARESSRHAADHITVKLRLLGHDAPQAVDLPRLGRQVAVLPDEDGRMSELGDAVRWLAETEHRRWCAERLLGGWRPLPCSEANISRWFDAATPEAKATRDAFREHMKTDRRCHIDLVPFERLPKGHHYNEQLKDHEMIAIIPSLLTTEGSVR